MSYLGRPEILDVQRESGKWRAAAYPDTATIELQALGVAEEMGELVHAVLKYKQGIRGYDFEKTRDEVADAIGDIFIYMCGVADHLNINVVTAVETVWQHVKDRNITQGSNPGINATPVQSRELAECGQPDPCGHAPDGDNHPVNSDVHNAGESDLEYPSGGPF